jgi:sortase B
VCAIGFSAYQLLGIDNKYRDERKTHELLLAFKPEPIINSEPSPVKIENTNSGTNLGWDLKAAQNNINKEIIGWITVPDTDIDYPFVQGVDNAYYLTHDPYRKTAAAGSVFMDSRNQPDFFNFNTFLYGHHMKNGSIFGTLINFTDQSFLNNAKNGWIYVEGTAYEMIFFASLVIPASDEAVYNTIELVESKQKSYLRYIKENARAYREIDWGNDSEFDQKTKIDTLSTCAYDFADARLVVMARLLAHPT